MIQVPRLDSSPALFIKRGLLSPGFCLLLREVAEQAAAGKASVVREEGDVLDEKYRRTKRARLPEEASARLGECLADLRDLASRHFGLHLTAAQPPQLLIYQPGDFFRVHQDRATSPNIPTEISGRQLSAVIFLNDYTRLPTQDGFCGGELRFFMLDPRADHRNARTVVRGEQGMAVAFRSDVFHEVAPVTAGERYSVVSWFSGP